jgi:hypothetical protein
MVDAPGNQPPVACAGADQVITLPASTVNLDGTCSADPDNNITAYNWTKISGPSSFNIANANAAQTQLTGLVQGVYQFELKVTDAGGLFSKDTMQVTVKAEVSLVACDGTNRPQVNAQLIPIGTLSQNRPGISVASAGNKILFAGGSTWPNAPYATTRVDIYDIVSQTWSTAELSTPRWQIATVTAGNKIFFAGGGYYDNADNGYSESTVDIYDVSTNNWTVSKLSSPRHDIAAATVGNKVLFSGGMDGDCLDCISNKVDVYDLTNNTWSIMTMSEPKTAHTAIVANNKVYFAGGISGWIPLPNNNFDWIVSNKIDVYDNSTNSWSTTTANLPRYYFAGISVGDKIYCAGGITNGNTNSCKVEIKDINNGNSSIQYLSAARNFYVDGGQNAIVKDNKILLFAGGRYYSSSGSRQFDIYDVTTNTWSIGICPVNIQGASVISVNNIVYITDGLHVWRLDF